jgi:hypothetical protein
VDTVGRFLDAYVYNIPIVRVSIDSATPHRYRGHYRAQHDAGLECMATLCLAGPASEEMFCESIADGSDQVDFEMARRYLAPPVWPAAIGSRVRPPARRRRASGTDGMGRASHSSDR